uniref:Recombinant pox virus host range protein n=1 Tax=Myxoma virus TaxID=10273 RepID=A0A6G7NPK5_9POXV|nr:recombinant pox virus host range protein [Myxoma virus]UPO78964.1 ha-M064 [Myxoma virus]UPO78969.1 M064 [Myxoma virus]
MKMGINHCLDIFVTTENLSLKQVNLYRGDSYGCTIKVKTDVGKNIEFVIVLEPDWSEVVKVKPILMRVNGKKNKLKLVEKTLMTVIYTTTIFIEKNSVIEFYSDRDELYTDGYPSLVIDMIKKQCKIVEVGRSYIYIDFPINDEDKLKYKHKDDCCIEQSDDDDDDYENENKGENHNDEDENNNDEDDGDDEGEDDDDEDDNDDEYRYYY